MRALDPSAAGRVVTLRAAAWRAQDRRRAAGAVRRLGAIASPSDDGRVRDPAYDIADPIGGPLRDYRAMGDEVRALVRALVDRWSGR